MRNGRGEVTKIGLVLDYDKDTSINTNMLSSYGQYEKWNTENFGFVKKVESGYYKYGERDNDTNDEILPLTSNTIVVFDSSKPEDKVYMGSEKDIYSKEEVGANASAILTNQKNGISVFTIVFKNGADLFKTN